MGKNIIGIIGGGNMGEALIKGLYKSDSVFVCETNLKRVKFLKTTYKIHSEQDINSLVAKVDIIILAVKPQEMESVLGQIKSSKDKLFISIAAGLTTKYFEGRLGAKARVIRAMPNLSALIREGMTGVCRGQYVQGTDLKLAQDILGTIGETITVKEGMMDAVTAVSGSGPAYLFLFVEQWINAAVKLGFDQEQARDMVHKTVFGSAHLLKDSPFDAGELRAKVTSKGGTTQAAMDVFSKRKFGQLMKDALTAAKKRAKELAK